jgi:hypothetical protein
MARNYKANVEKIIARLLELLRWRVEECAVFVQ